MREREREIEREKRTLTQVNHQIEHEDVHAEHQRNEKEPYDKRLMKGNLWPRGIKKGQ